MEFVINVFNIMVVNIVLSGDNAVVIAMASRCLPQVEQKKAIWWGSVGAIILRILLTLVAVILLTLPYLQCLGGILLIWIAGKLLLESNRNEGIVAASSFWMAVKTIIVADVVMSLDNTLAIAAVAKGNLVLLIFGLALSVPLILWGSKAIIVLMEKFPIIIYAGAALIAWTAGEMIVKDKRIGALLLTYLPEWFLPLVITGGVVGAGIWYKRYRELPAKMEQTRRLDDGENDIL